MSDDAKAKRRFTRVDFDATTTINDSSGNHWQSQLIDISLKEPLIN